MNNKVISLLKITAAINLCVGSHSVDAAYFYGADVPDYDIVSTPCHGRHYSPAKHHHYRAKHHSIAAAQHKGASYSIMKYYVYSDYKGDFIWVPSPGDCNGTLVEVRHLKSTRDIFQEPHTETVAINHDQDDGGHDMDGRTGDDIDNEY